MVKSSKFDVSEMSFAGARLPIQGGLYFTRVDARCARKGEVIICYSSNDDITLFLTVSGETYQVYTENFYSYFEYISA